MDRNEHDAPMQDPHYLSGPRQKHEQSLAGPHTATSRGSTTTESMQNINARLDQLVQYLNKVENELSERIDHLAGPAPQPETASAHPGKPQSDDGSLTTRIHYQIDWLDQLSAKIAHNLNRL